MRRKRQGRSADLDITPLIDVMFMLIIFFVLTASFVQGAVSVELPSGHGASKDKNETVTVTIEKNGNILWDGKNISKNELKALAQTVSGRDVLIAGDKGASYGTVAEILSILREEGVVSAGLMTQGKD